MAALRSYLRGEEPRLAVVAVLTTAVAAAIPLFSLGVFGIGVSGTVGEAAFAVVFVVVPTVAGCLCGWRRLGYPAAAASGLAPGGAFYVVVAVGAALGIGTFGGGDSPLFPFSLMVGSVGFLLATVGFGVGVAVAVLRS